MNAETIVKHLRLCAQNGDCYKCEMDNVCDPNKLLTSAADLIESLQAQLAEAKRRTEKALGYIKKIFGCDDCVHNDDTNYETCKSCNIYDKWQWRGDAEEGDAE